MPRYHTTLRDADGSAIGWATRCRAKAGPCACGSGLLATLLCDGYHGTFGGQTCNRSGCAKCMRHSGLYRDLCRACVPGAKEPTP